MSLLNAPYRPVIGMCGYMGSGKDTSASLLIAQLKQRGIHYRAYALAQPLKEFTAHVFGVDERYMHDRKLKEQTLTLGFDNEELRLTFCRHYTKLLTKWATATGAEYENLIRLRPDLAAWQQWPHFLKAIRAHVYELSLTCKIIRLLLGGKWLSGDTLIEASPRQLLQKIGTEFFRTRVSPDFWVELVPSDSVIVTDVRFPNEVDSVRKKHGLIVKVRNSNIKNVDTTHASEQYIAEIKEDYLIANDGVNMGTLERSVSGLVKHLYE